MIDYFPVLPQPEEDCAICWEPLKASKKASKVVIAHTRAVNSLKQWIFAPASNQAPCRAIHQACLLRWTSHQSNMCPICRATWYQINKTAPRKGVLWCAPWVRETWHQVDKSALKKSVLRCALPVIIGTGGFLAVYHLIHNALAADAEASLDKTLLSYNWQMSTDVRSQFLSRLVARQITHLMLRVSWSLFICEWAFVQAVAWPIIGRGGFTPDWFWTAGLICAGICISGTLMDNFYPRTLLSDMTSQAVDLLSAIQG